MKLRKFSILTVIILLLSSLLVLVAPVQSSPTALPQLEIVGTQVQYTNGTQLWLKGFNLPFYLWYWGAKYDQTEMQYVGSWNCNYVVFTNKDLFRTEEACRNTLTNLVEWAAQEGMYSHIKYHPQSGTSDLSGWDAGDWSDWIDHWEYVAQHFVDEGLNTNVIYTLIIEPEGISASTYQTRMRQCIDAVRAIDPNVPIVVHALDMYGGVGLWTEAPTSEGGTNNPISRDNIGFAYHDHWWVATKSTTKASIRNKRQNIGATWCLENNRAVFCEDFNYDADVGSDGETWLRNFIEVMEESPYEFAGWAHWGWLRPEDDDINVGAITAYHTGTATTQGSIVQEYLPETDVSPPEPPTGLPFEDRFESANFDKWNRTDLSTVAGGTFGKTSIGSSYTANTDNDIMGGTFASGGSGSASSISWYGRGTDTGSEYVKCAIYYSNNTLLAETERLSVGSTIQWYTHDFPSPPSISGSTDYILVVWFDGSAARFYKDDIGSNPGVRQDDVGSPNGFPDPLVPTAKYMNYSVYCAIDSSGGASLEISTTSYIDSYSGNFTTSTTDGAYALAELYFSGTYEYLSFRSWVWFDSLPDTGDALSIMQFLNSSGGWICDLQYENSSGAYKWRLIVYNDGGNLEYTSNQALSVQTWSNVEVWFNTTGEVNLWVNETEKISQTGDYNDGGEISKVQIRVENVGVQGSTKTVLHDYVRVDDERVYAETVILFFTSHYISTSTEETELANVKVNGSYTDSDGLLSFANLTYNQVYTFAIDPPDNYYPAWVVGIDSLTWNGSAFIVQYNLTQTNHYISPYFFDYESDRYISFSNATLTTISFLANKITILASANGESQIQVHANQKPNAVEINDVLQEEEDGWTYENNTITLTITGTKIELGWGDHYFNFDFKDLDDNDVETVILWELWNASGELDYTEGTSQLAAGNYTLKTFYEEHLINQTVLDTQECGDSTITVDLSMKQLTVFSTGYIAFNKSVTSLEINLENETHLRFTPYSEESNVLLIVDVPGRPVSVEKDGVPQEYTYVSYIPRHVYLVASNLSVWDIVWEPSEFPSIEIPEFTLPSTLQFLIEGDLFGFVQSLFGTAFMGADMFFAFLVFIVSMAIYIRTKSLILLTILALLTLGAGFMVSMPLISGFGVLLTIFGVAGLLHQVYSSRTS